ncbi:Uncharacterised protein [Mycobacteroides abscessus subsp. abscessus]|nr:Uncharacterised protein [Mycobacteroides abscessus subsp. abscessus]
MTAGSCEIALTSSFCTGSPGASRPTTGAANVSTYGSPTCAAIAGPESTIRS